MKLAAKTNLSKSILSFLFLLVSFNGILAQCTGNDCGVCNVTASVVNIVNATINTGTSTIPGTVTTSDVGSPISVTSTGCGEIILSVALSFDWQQGANVSWIHGVAFTASPGWTVAQGGSPGGGWLYQNSITGCCSGVAYGAGSYFDGTTQTSNCCGGGTPGNPADNWGINCSTTCPSFTFDLAYCPSSVGTVTESITFTLTDDGETGDWSQPAGCVFGLTIPIELISIGTNLPDSGIIGPINAGTSVTLDAGLGCNTYLWSTNETTQSIVVTPTTNTTYCVTVDAGMGGCQIIDCVEVITTNSCEPSYSLTGTEAGTADYESTGTITSTQIIESTASVDYDSATDIELQAGFEVILGAVFEAFIDGCNNGAGGVNLSEINGNQ